MLAIASNSKRPMLQSSRNYMMKTGEAAWGKDTYHLVAKGGERACFDEDGRTLCGLKTYGWTSTWEADELDRHCCTRCAAKVGHKIEAAA